MFNIDFDGTITITSGDSGIVNVNIVDSDGNKYEPGPNDTLTFTVKADPNDEDYIIQKLGLPFELVSEDTIELAEGTYYYDVQLEDGDRRIYTIVVPTEFRVRHETDEERYGKRMMKYYPPVVASIIDIQAIVYSEYPLFKHLNDDSLSILDDRYLTRGKCSEARISQWESNFGISADAGSTLDERRDNIVARLRGGRKLNTATINSVVDAFTGGKAHSYFEDGVLYVSIQPPEEERAYNFSAVEAELERLKPAHIELSVYRNYRTWADAMTVYPTWSDMTSDTWDDVDHP